MASASSQGSIPNAQPTGTQDQAETPVPMEGVDGGPPGLVGKRPRKPSDQYEDAEDEEVPTELADPVRPQRPLTLEDIMSNLTRGFSDCQTNMTAIRRDLGTVGREAREAKEMAAKATTIAHETKEAMTTLEQRVARLEASPGKPQTDPAYRTAAPKGGMPKRDWDYLGGDDGDTLIVGGFRAWADKEEKQQEWTSLQDRLPSELRDAIADTIVPASQGSIVICKIHKAQDPKTTRTSMLEWCKKFREMKLQYRADDETSARTYYAQPSKPYEMRQRNAKTSGMLDGFKLMVGEARAPKLRMDLSQWEDILRATPPGRAQARPGHP